VQVLGQVVQLAERPESVRRQALLALLQEPELLAVQEQVSV
jgi:hypothetical protein